MTRRAFARTLSFALAALSFALAGCTSFDTIVAYVNLAIKGFSAIVAVLGKLGIAIPGGATIIAAVSAALSAITGAITAYNAADPADKASTKLKITLAIDEAINQLQGFWSSLGIQNATVQALITAIIAGLEGFLPSLPVPPPTTARYRTFQHMLAIVPHKYSHPQDFQVAFNQILTNAGYAQDVI